MPQLLRAAANDWLENNALRLSAALAYYSVFSIAPLLVLSVGLAGWFFGADAARGRLDDQLKGLVGGQAAMAVQTMVQSTSQPAQSLVATAVGLVTLLLGASGVFGQLKDALNTVWGVKPKPGSGWGRFLRERLLSFGMVLVIGFLLLVSFLLTTLLSTFNRWIGAVLSLPDWVWGGAGMLVSLAVVTLLFALIFKVLPDVEIDWRHVWIGAAATALLFEIGKFGLAYYLGRESTASSFGAAGSVVLLLLWVYYASCILLFGAEFTKVYALAEGATPLPSALAEPISVQERAQQGLTPQPTIEPPRSAPAEKSPASAALAVLIVENHADTLKYLRQYFQKRGSAPRTAGTLQEALEKLAAEPCDFLITDIGLPDGDGWELMEKARLPASVYAVAMSGFSSDSDFRRSQAVGFRHHLLKPFSPEHLDEHLAEALREHAARR